MTTLTFKVPTELALKLKRESQRKRVPKSRILREALAKELKSVKGNPTLYDLMKDGIGCISSGKGDLSTNPKYLEGFGNDAGNHRHRTARRAA